MGWPLCSLCGLCGCSCLVLVDGWNSTLARPKLQYISCYLSVMALLLLVVAIIGTLGKSWMIALEVITISHIMSTVLTLKRSSFSSSPSRLLPCSQPRGPHKCTLGYLQTPSIRGWHVKRNSRICTVYNSRKRLQLRRERLSESSLWSLVRKL